MRPSLRIAQIACVLAAVALGAIFLPKSSLFPRSSYGPILHEEQSDYSHIRVRGSGSKRSLLFVSEAGKEQLQSAVDLEHPGTLEVDYTKALFASLLFQPEQKRILIIGLGGGGMVHFALERFPEMQVEVVEIDPAVVRLAKEYFDLSEGEQVTIHTADAFDFIREPGSPYDAIYLDAFLRPSVDADAEGATARLKTVSFLREIKSRLRLGGVLACNLISYRKSTRGDLEALGEVFPEVSVFEVRGTGNIAVIAHRREDLVGRSELMEAARQAEEQFGSEIPFRELVRALRE